MAAPQFKPLMMGIVGLQLAACSVLPHLGLPASTAAPKPAEPVRSIAILGISEPPSAQILSAGSAFSSGDDATPSQPNPGFSDSYTQLLAARHVQFGPDMFKALADALGADGYRVVDLPEQKAFVTPDGKSEDLSQVRSDADAVLVIRITGAGYITSPQELSYQPWITASARLLRRHGGEELYSRTFSGGFPMSQSAINLPSSSRYRYPYFRDLMGAADESIAGLKDSAHDIASALAKDLFKGARAEPLPVAADSGGKTATLPDPGATRQAPADAAPATDVNPRQQ